ncbi:hypothetical protein CASFOL_004763 [Castilleja foliolosa]|uniref:Replication factor A C-terminal domain-containing protein n=1 Tax=Castilleja foliolosa TaxID=1961234 RepID=A0ABD3EEZ9_9LAMI
MANQDWDIQGREVYELFGLKYAEVRTIQTLKDFLKEDGRNYWVHAKIVSIVSRDDFWYRACMLCGKPVEAVAGQNMCFRCRFITVGDIYRYNLEVIVVDDTGYMNLVLSDKASTRLIRLETVDCIALQGYNVRKLPTITIIQEEIVGTTALFEVIFSSDDGLVRRFNVSRFNDDPDVIEAYKHRYLHEEVVEANVAEEEADDEEQWEHWQEEEEEGSDKSCVDD